jgi:hypothetical protein
VLLRADREAHPATVEVRFGTPSRVEPTTSVRLGGAAIRPPRRMAPSGRWQSTDKPIEFEERELNHRLRSVLQVRKEAKIPTHRPILSHKPQ